MGIDVSIKTEVSLDARWVEDALRDDVGAVTEVVEQDEDHVLLWYDGFVVYVVRVDHAGRLDGQRVRVRGYVSFELVGYERSLRDLKVFALRLLARLSGFKGASVVACNGEAFAAAHGGGVPIVVREAVVGPIIEQPDLARSGVPHALGLIEWNPWGN